MMISPSLSQFCVCVCWTMSVVVAYILFHVMMSMDEHNNEFVIYGNHDDDILRMNAMINL